MSETIPDPIRTLHDSLPLTDPDRYALEDPAVEAAFARLAAMPIAAGPAPVAPAAPSGPSLGDQLAAFTVLEELARLAPQLPAALITVHDRGHFDIQVGLAEFDAWRVVLGIAPEDVQLHGGGSFGGWLAADVVRAGIPVHLAGHGITIPGGAE